MPRCFCGSGRRPGHQSSPPAAAHPHQNVSAKSRRFVFASRRQLLSPKVQSPVLCTRRNPQRVLDPRQLFSRRANKCSPASPRGVTSAHGLRPRCLHDTGARSEDCGPQKNQMEALFAAPAARKSLTRRHRANTAPLHGFTRGRSGRSNQDRQVQNESGLRSCSEF